MPTIVQLTASSMLGGPERQMLGLAAHFPQHYRTVFVSFAEAGRCRTFIGEVQRQRGEAHALANDAPHLRAVLGELPEVLCHVEADLVCCHGYKANLLGRLAARRAGLPVIAVSRGWTGETSKVRLYEMLDRWCLRWMDRVVCVSEGQAVKVRRAGVAPDRVEVIRNAVRAERFDRSDAKHRAIMEGLFAKPPRWIVGGAGRLSPEKGFGLFVEAAARVARLQPDASFLLFGDGPLKAELSAKVRTLGLESRFILAGHRPDLDAFMPYLDLLVLPSFTEGLPNVVLESLAAGVPVVATAVGGTPEVLDDAYSGFLVASGNVAALADRINALLTDDSRRRAMGGFGQRRMRAEFTFAAQARHYVELFDEILARRSASTPSQRGPQTAGVGR